MVHNFEPSQAADITRDDTVLEETEPVDALVNIVIGILERSSVYLRAVANQVFMLLCGLVTESTVALIIEVRSRPRFLCRLS
jgi:DNA polymerase phi